MAKQNGYAVVKIHSKHLTTQRLKQAYEAGVLPAVAEQILSDCNTYVRKQDGTLADSAHLERDGRDIVWSTKYAKKVYYTGTPRKNVNAKATLRWCEVAERLYSKKWADMATKLVQGEKP